jgi:hypothetical protein
MPAKAGIHAFFAATRSEKKASASFLKKRSKKLFIPAGVETINRLSQRPAALPTSCQRTLASTTFRHHQLVRI